MPAPGDPPPRRDAARGAGRAAAVPEVLAAGVIGAAGKRPGQDRLPPVTN